MSRKFPFTRNRPHRGLTFPLIGFDIYLGQVASHTIGLKNTNIESQTHNDGINLFNVIWHNYKRGCVSLAIMVMSVVASGKRKVMTTWTPYPRTGRIIQRAQKKLGKIDSKIASSKFDIILCSVFSWNSFDFEKNRKLTTQSNMSPLNHVWLLLVVSTPSPIFNWLPVVECRGEQI